LGKYYYFAIVSFALAVGAKIVSLFFGISFLIYLGFNIRKVTWNILLKSFLYGTISFAIPNIFLLNRLIFSRYLRWLFAASDIVTNGLSDSPSKSILLNLYDFSIKYCNVFAFFIVVLLSFFGIWIWRNKLSFYVVSFLIPCSMVVFYFFFCIFYCHSPSHYGILLMFFLPFLVFYFFKIWRYSYLAIIFLFLLNHQNIVQSVLRLAKPYSFSQVDFEPCKTKSGMIKISESHVAVYHKKNKNDEKIPDELLRLAYDKK
jgi:hypothetical protein